MRRGVRRVRVRKKRRQIRKGFEYLEGFGAGRVSRFVCGKNGCWENKQITVVIR